MTERVVIVQATISCAISSVRRKAVRCFLGFVLETPRKQFVLANFRFSKSSD